MSEATAAPPSSSRPLPGGSIGGSLATIIFVAVAAPYVHSARFTAAIATSTGGPVLAPGF